MPSALKKKEKKRSTAVVESPKKLCSLRSLYTNLEYIWTRLYAISGSCGSSFFLRNTPISSTTLLPKVASDRTFVVNVSLTNECAQGSNNISIGRVETGFPIVKF